MSKGKIAGKEPLIIDIEEGKVYAWCACGLSSEQPFCNGAHKESDHLPHILKADETKRVAFCTCKQTSNPPFCDGTHNGI